MALDSPSGRLIFVVVGNQLRKNAVFGIFLIKMVQPSSFSFYFMYDLHDVFISAREDH